MGSFSSLMKIRFRSHYVALLQLTKVVIPDLHEHCFILVVIRAQVKLEYNPTLLDRTEPYGDCMGTAFGPYSCSGPYSYLKYSWVID